MSKKVGVIVNPVAGLGGRVGLKGSDGLDIIEQALALGARPEASGRAKIALAQLSELDPLPAFYTYGGEMGERQSQELGFPYILVGSPAGERSSAADTVTAARLLKEAGVDLLLFAGGDGTARDICQALGEDLPCLGIPAGVKIHSAAYAVNPLNAGLAARDFLREWFPALKRAAVMDIDEELFRAGRVAAKLYGYLLTPADNARMQESKSGRLGEEDELQGMAAFVAELMEPGVLYLVGPGSTTNSVLDELGLAGTLLGVDAVLDRQLAATDLSEAGIWRLLEEHQGRAKIIITVIGGQGNLLGRGNQQFSPRILRRLGKKNILVVSGAGKLAALEGRPLRVDTGDTALDQELSGFWEVAVDYARYTMVKVSC